MEHDDSLKGMFSPPERDEDSVLDAFRLELIQALHQSEEVRTCYGLRRNEDGSFVVSDLPKIKALPEETKHILREFLKANGTPKPKLVSQEVVGKSTMSPTIRQSLDELYSRLDHLQRTAKPRRFTGS